MRLTRRGRLTVTLGVAGLLLLAAAASYALLRTPVGPALGLRTAPPCQLSAGRTTLEWTREQARSASTVAAVGARIGATRNGIGGAVARALRRPDDRVLDAAGAREVYRQLPDRARPSARSLAVAAALLGRRGPALTCRVGAFATGVPRESPGRVGLTPRAAALRTAMREVFGWQPLGGFAPAGVTTGHVEGSAHYEGRAIDVFFRPVSRANQRSGWLQAQWAVAHADELRLATVIFDRRIWTASRSGAGWRPYVYPDGPTDNPVLLHEDHVHLDVLEGRRPPGSGVLGRRVAASSGPVGAGW